MSVSFGTAARPRVRRSERPMEWSPQRKPKDKMRAGAGHPQRSLVSFLKYSDIILEYPQNYPRYIFLSLWVFFDVSNASLYIPIFIRYYFTNVSPPGKNIRFTTPRLCPCARFPLLLANDFVIFSKLIPQVLFSLYRNILLPSVIQFHNSHHEVAISHLLFSHTQVEDSIAMIHVGIFSIFVLLIEYIVCIVLI